MSTSYGIELRNAAGELVYDSRVKTVRVVASGYVTFDSSNINTEYTVTFPPQATQPEGLITNVGCLYTTLSPCIGKFAKDGSGMYVSCKVACKSTAETSVSTPTIPFPWHVPYVIFI